MIIAAIDIGSNAARLLINEVSEPKKGKPEFTKLNLLRIPLRLGMDVFTKGKIGEEREQMILDSMIVFSNLMKIYKVQHYRACATSAMRDAKNGEEIIKKVKENSGIDIEIISGKEEASLVFENHVADTLDKNCAYLYIDVGGGSSELAFFENGKMKYENSFNIGTIRLLN
jgi:exopolyphosphatase/guanosine-5'-triphosphate,3'-diphosphate pyrophosphatase